ncbi:Lipoamide acyltransferase component of branched-chain alpha-keto acid dehydrogenase complex [Hibiscus syriacus]|uniref:dihydrolipoyllysine-residue (2-methylpropanoyl)transferase n=1 Tax=Hibiscus syriacus TaxID=106335 RepID=A0A6A2XJY0_HIBSY|nr:Lipoamide acyltransferase component of branched-chain alpha-keto acid dehydrogenase complex [Hibiscus syriacus]
MALSVIASISGAGVGDGGVLQTNAVADLPTNGIVDVPLAQTGEGIAECELLKWFVHEGDEVYEFQPSAKFKATKRLSRLRVVTKGELLKFSTFLEASIKRLIEYSRLLANLLGSIEHRIFIVGETLLKMAVEENRIEEIQVPLVIVGNLENEKHSDTKLNKGCTGGILSTPAVRNLGKEHGININDVQGSGKDGRVLKEDVLKYAAQTGIIKDPSFTATADLGELLHGEMSSPHVSVEGSGNYEDTIVPLRGFQRTMVKTMSMAAKVPHFHYVEEIDCDALAEVKASFQTNNSELGIKFTFLPILIKSLSMALSKYPMVNSCFNEESVEVILRGSHNIGIAIATPYGLVSLFFAVLYCTLSYIQITKELSRLQQLALDNKLSPNDISGGTITLSNIGAIGGKFGAPIVNLPEVAIIAMGRIQKLPRVAYDGDIYSTSIMTVNIGADHRVLDGATVARFCNEWKRFIEKPSSSCCI